MRRLLAVLLVCGLGFVLGAALREASRTAPTAAAVDSVAVDPATASDLEALRTAPLWMNATFLEETRSVARASSRSH